MRSLLFMLICFVSFSTFSQEAQIEEEFLPINIEEKEAFLSTKTGEYVFLDHTKIDPTKLETTNSGVIYTDIKIHTVAKKETISKIAQEHSITKDEIIRHNNLPNSNLSIGQELKIIKKLIIKSSSPVISQGESKIIARLQPGQTPTGLDSAPPVRASVATSNPVSVPSAVVKTENVVSKNVEVRTVEVKTNKVKTNKVEANKVEVKKAEVKKVEKEVETLAAFYTVKKGDNLYNIAKRNGVTVENLMKINGLTSNNLDIGQKLKLN